MLGRIFSLEGITKRGVLMALTLTEGMVMLPIAILFDAIGILLTILDFVYGTGVFITYFVNLMAAVVFATWTIGRGVTRSITGRMVETATKKAVMMLGGEEKGTSPIEKTAKKGIDVAKRGVSFSLSIIRFIIAFIIEMIPFVSNIFPAWTFFVIFELVQTEATQ